MKIKSIASICAKSKRIFIYDKKLSDGGIDVHWIGDGAVMYPAFELPNLEEESIFAIFDIPEKIHDKYTYKHEDLPTQFSFEDAVPCENRLESEKLNIVAAGRVLIPLKTQRGLVFIDAKYLSPLSDTADTLELYERLTTNGKIYIVAKTGFMIMAVIMPYEIINKDFVVQMEELTKQCRFAFSTRKAAGDIEEYPQIGFTEEQPEEDDDTT